MFFYLGLTLIIIFLFLIGRRYKNLTLPISFMILAFVGSTRGINVGRDVYIYTRNFNILTCEKWTWNYYTSFESGFNYYAILFKKFISQDSMIFIGSLSILFLILIYYFIKKESANPLLSVIFLVTLGYYTKSFNIMRQMLGLAFVLCSFQLLVKRKTIYYLILIFLLSWLIHKTLIVFIILPIFYIDKFNSVISKKTLVLIVILSFILGYLGYSSSLTDIIQLIAYSEKYKNYSIQIADSEVSILSNLLHTSFCILVIIISPNAKNIYLFTYVLGVILLNTLGALNPLFIRVAELFLIFRIIYFVELWYSIKSRNIRYVYRFSVVVYSFIVFLNILIKNYGDIFPYTTRLF